MLRVLGVLGSGNSWDMRVFKNHLMVKFPEHMYHLSNANEDQTEVRTDGGGAD